MEYELNIGRDNVHVDVDVHEDQDLHVFIHGKTKGNSDPEADRRSYDVGYDVVSDNRILLKINRDGHVRQINAYVSDQPGEKTIAINGRYYQVRDIEARGKRAKKGNRPDSPDLITPPTPAVVVKIHVAVGDPVEKGQKIIAVSAMKMETTLCAPYGGTVSKINTAINDKVAPGQILVEIEKAGTDQADSSGKGD